MDSEESFDFWYAVNNTQVIVRPKQNLESFGTTTIHYHLVTELMDAVDRIRVREGRIHAYRPEIITPSGFMDSLLEGFSEEQAEDYMSWLRHHEQDLLILKYGFKIRKEALDESVIHDKIQNVLDQIRDDLTARDQPMRALLHGVDEPWEVCLIKLMVEMVQQSIALNAGQLRKDPQGHHSEINAAFERAAQDSSKIQSLANLLQKKNLFHEYEDRFYSLVRTSRRGR